MYIRQIVECGGISRVEYGYEPEDEFLDNEPEVLPSRTYCGECDFYTQDKCQFTNKFVSQDNIACSSLQITYPF